MRGKHVIGKIVSGGQTGVDRAALDVAQELGIPRGGWCPRGRLAEDGPIDARYPLEETPSSEYAQRTRWNVRDSDGTLVLTRASPRGGTAFTLRCARRLHRPVLVVDLSLPSEPAALREWAGIDRVKAATRGDLADCVFGICIVARDEDLRSFPGQPGIGPGDDSQNRLEVCVSGPRVRGPSRFVVTGFENRSRVRRTAARFWRPRVSTPPCLGFAGARSGFRLQRSP